MDAAVVTLRFKVPGPDSPGFLRRSIQAVEFSEKVKQGVTADVLREMTRFLANFVIEPADQAGKIEALMDASEVEIMSLLEALTGGKIENPTKPTPSESGTS